jgi:hypothetical protein
MSAISMGPHIKMSAPSPHGHNQTAPILWPLFVYLPLTSAVALLIENGDRMGLLAMELLTSISLNLILELI